MIEALFGWPPPVLDPMGPYSEPVRTVAWALFALGVLVTALVVGALFLAWRGPQRWRERLGGERSILVFGVAVPAVVLASLLVWGLTLTASLDRPPTSPVMSVRVIGEMWWFRVQYLDEDGNVIVEDANELRLPVGRPVQIELKSADVIHSFWVPHLAGKKDMIPGRTNYLTVQADRPGEYGAVCAEFCGRAHALMGMLVIATPVEDFAAWWRGRLQLRRSAMSSGSGFASFVDAGCAACHAIDGTPAQGKTGPNLTNVAARQKLGAGILTNKPGAMMGWVANSQSIKPGNRMPSYERLEPAELQSIVDYLGTLK